MKPLPQKFSKHGFEFELIKREGDVALLKKTRGAYAGYEVVKIQKHNGVEYEGSVTEAAEHLPGNSDWGISGFTYLLADLDRAERRFAQLVAFKQHQTATKDVKGISRSFKLTLKKLT